jgi:hypothetical protein
VGKAFNITIPDDIASVEIGDRQKAMPLTFVNDIAFAFLGAVSERWEIN